MTKNQLRNKLFGSKIQVSGNLDKLKEVLEGLDFSFEDVKDFIFIDLNGKVHSVDPQVFKSLSVSEIDLKSLYDEFQKVFDPVIPEEGDILTCDLDNKRLTFIVYSVTKDLCKGLGVDLGINRYTTDCCRYATVEERNSLIEYLRNHGYTVVVLDGKVDTFYLRKYKQLYWTISMNLKEGKFEVTCNKEKYGMEDDINFTCGNYFKTESDAVNKIKEMYNAFLQN